MTTLTWDGHRGHAASYDVVGLGWNYRTDELRAALGLAQLSRYRLRLGSHPLLRIPSQGAWGTSAYHLAPVLVPSSPERDRLRVMLRERGIQKVNPLYLAHASRLRP